MDNSKRVGASFTSYLTYGPMGLYVRLGTDDITGFSSTSWGGFYYVAARPSAVLTRFYTGAIPGYDVSAIGAFEVRPWGFPVPYAEIALKAKLSEDRLRRIVGQLLVSVSARVESCWRGDVDLAVVDEGPRPELG